MELKKFGHLSPLKQAVGSLWLCRCDCGEYVLVSAYRLKHGFRTSCGCLNGKKEIKYRKHLTRPEAAANSIMKKYQTIAKRKNMPFLLSSEQFLKLIMSNCFYCGSKPAREQPVPKNSYKSGIRFKKDENYKETGSKILITYNGLGQIDDSKGYTIDNVVPSCEVCNQARNGLTIQEFKSWINQLSKNINNWRMNPEVYQEETLES